MIQAGRAMPYIGLANPTNFCNRFSSAASATILVTLGITPWVLVAISPALSGLAITSAVSCATACSASFSAPTPPSATAGSPPPVTSLAVCDSAIPRAWAAVFPRNSPISKPPRLMPNSCRSLLATRLERINPNPSWPSASRRAGAKSV